MAQHLCSSFTSQDLLLGFTVTKILISYDIPDLAVLVTKETFSVLSHESEQANIVGDDDS